MQAGNQKLKILYLMKILLEETDDTHSITMSEILSKLSTYGVKAERKSIYDDIDCLKNYGLDIIMEKEGKTYSYRIASRQFELAELKLLVDSVQSSKFITEKKSRQLIKKIEGLASRHEASKLQRQVYTMERVKAENESIYYNVDQIHDAIASNVQITFQYFNWDANKQKVLRKGSALYKVSPWALSWDDENYYLVAFDSAENKIKHYRVDKMLQIQATAEKREGTNSFDIGAYAKKMFGMFGGEEETVRILCKNELAGVMIDRFGKDVAMVKVDDAHFYVNVKVAVSSHFLGWIMALGDGAKIVGPECVMQWVQNEVDRLVRQYK